MYELNVYVGPYLEITPSWETVKTPEKNICPADVNHKVTKSQKYCPHCGTALAKKTGKEQAIKYQDPSEYDLEDSFVMVDDVNLIVGKTIWLVNKSRHFLDTTEVKEFKHSDIETKLSEFVSVQKANLDFLRFIMELEVKYGTIVYVY